LKKYLLFLLLGLVIEVQAQAGKPFPDSLNTKKLRTVIITAGGLYATSLAVLDQVWYKQYRGDGFHWQDDAGEWILKDKMGHLTTAYQVGEYGYRAMRKAGLSEKKAIWYGGSWGFVYMASIETLDGFSKGWGASPTDLLANTVGAGLFISQQAIWHEQRIRPKFSYHPSLYAQYRPDLLGENYWQRIIKDYNGQTNWLSVDIASFLKSDRHFPPWLCVSFGYGAKGMIGAYANPATYQGKTLPQFRRTSQFFLSFDVDWTRIHTSSSVLRFIFRTISFIKIPAPAIEYNPENGLIFHPIYF